MSVISKEIMDSVFGNVLKTMAFMFVEPVSDITELDVPKRALKSEIVFSGFKHGSMTIIVDFEMCLEVVENTLGMEVGDTVTKEMAFDALKELLNITCGSLLTSVYGEKPVFDLMPPCIDEIPENVWQDLKSVSDCWFYKVDEWPVALIVNN